MSRVLIGIIRVYQYILSPDQSIFYRRPTCRMHPSCSEYTVFAIQKYGPLKGVFFGIARVGRCHPWQKKLVDLP